MLLAVEDPERVLFEPLAAFLGKVASASLEMFDQSGPPGIAGRRVAERVELELDPGADSELGEQLIGQSEHLDVGGGLARADDLGIELVELAVASLLRPLVAEGGAVGRDLDRRELLPAFGQIGPADSGGEFGPKGQAVAAAILELYISLATMSVVSPIERAKTWVASNTGISTRLEAVEPADPVERLDHRLETVGFLAPDVLGAPDLLRALAHRRLP